MTDQLSVADELRGIAQSLKGLVQQVNGGERGAVVVTLQGLITRVNTLSSKAATAESAASRAATYATRKAAKRDATSRDVDTHAKASEDAPDYASLDATLVALGVPAHQVLAVESACVAEAEGLSLAEAMQVCAKRFPKVAHLYFTERS
jgi:hypothetical protein